MLVVDGLLVTTLEPGQYYWWRNSSVIHLPKTDIRQLSMELNGQEILTRDKVQVRINFTLSYKVTDLELALLGNKEFDKQLYTMAQLALRAFTGTKSLDELMDSKDEVSVAIQAEVAPNALTLGVTLMSCGVKDIILPGDVREIMNQVLIAEKRAQANTIMRREETAATRSLLNTARLMEDNAMLYKMKEMEYVEKVAEKINNISISGGGQLLDQLKQLLVRS